MHSISQFAGREDFEYTDHEEMIKVEGDRYTNYSGLIITQCVLESKYHIVAQNMHNYCMSKKS
jgi:hypothetical protein